MLLNNFYFRLRPLIPRSVRLAIRRPLALRMLERVRDTWPILPGSEQPPVGWPGWPERKQFAFVLTHDVESAAGLARVQQLAELEMKLGFRSCFYFIPEGPYSVPPALLSWLADHGFEVGVHDLHHDGKLYSNKKSFSAKARRINHYLNEWGAVGFRSAFMLHNYEWLHSLNILYDASSFDTDPFEPQPEGVNTIFPFWVPSPKAPEGITEQGARRSAAPLPTPDSSSVFQNSSVSAFGSRSGYLELPYTLVQDSTLFLTLREKTTTTWKRKLDWIAAHGGMALVNVHPDYLELEASKSNAHTYPVQRLIDLLSHVRHLYHDCVWHALPREVAFFVRPRRLARTSRFQNRCSMTSHSRLNEPGPHP